MASYYDYIEQHEVGSGKWEQVLTESNLTKKDALAIIKMMKEVFPNIKMVKTGGTQVYIDKESKEPMFAVRY